MIHNEVGNGFVGFILIRAHDGHRAVLDCLTATTASLSPPSSFFISLCSYSLVEDCGAREASAALRQSPWPFDGHYWCLHRSLFPSLPPPSPPLSFSLFFSLVHPSFQYRFGPSMGDDIRFWVGDSWFMLKLTPLVYPTLIKDVFLSTQEKRNHNANWISGTLELFVVN